MLQWHVRGMSSLSPLALQVWLMGTQKTKQKQNNLSSVDGTKIKYENIHTAFSCLIFGLVKNSHLNVAQDLDGPASAAILVLKG